MKFFSDFLNCSKYVGNDEIVSKKEILFSIVRVISDWFLMYKSLSLIQKPGSNFQFGKFYRNLNFFHRISKMHIKQFLFNNSSSMAVKLGIMVIVK